jgi:hypothetical protein
MRELRRLVAMHNTHAWRPLLKSEDGIRCYRCDEPIKPGAWVCWSTRDQTEGVKEFNALPEEEKADWWCETDGPECTSCELTYKANQYLEEYSQYFGSSESRSYAEAALAGYLDIEDFGPPGDEFEPPRYDALHYILRRAEEGDAIRRCVRSMEHEVSDSDPAPHGVDPEVWATLCDAAAAWSTWLEAVEVLDSPQVVEDARILVVIAKEYLAEESFVVRYLQRVANVEIEPPGPDLHLEPQSGALPLVMGAISAMQPIGEVS